MQDINIPSENTHVYRPHKVLITGGCGFIGSNFINYMLKNHENIEIFNIDAIYYCGSINNITTTKNYHFIHGNIQSYDLIKYILTESKIDTVIHFAAQSHVDNSFENSLQYTRDNVLGTHTLLEACRSYGGIKRFIHVSTDEVYGESMSIGENGKTDKSMLYPTNPYAASKAAAEMLVMSYQKSYKMPIITTRGNNVYGKNQYPEKLIPKFTCLLKHGKKCQIHGSGNNLRTFVHVNDAVRAFELILFNGEIGSVYNIGSDNEFSVMDVTHKIIKLVYPNIDLMVDAVNFIEYTTDRNFNDYRYHIDSSLLMRLGWKPLIPFDEGLKETVQWYLSIDENKHWNTKDHICSK